MKKLFILLAAGFALCGCSVLRSAFELNDGTEGTPAIDLHPLVSMTFRFDRYDIIEGEAVLATIVFRNHSQEEVSFSPMARVYFIEGVNINRRPPLADDVFAGRQTVMLGASVISIPPGGYYETAVALAIDLRDSQWYPYELTLVLRTGLYEWEPQNIFYSDNSRTLHIRQNPLNPRR